MVRRDPFAMLPFTGYNMSDYFQHWLDVGNKLAGQGAKLPAIYCGELVPQGRSRQVRLAWLWREHARAQVDDRPASKARQVRAPSMRLASARASTTSTGKA